MLEEKDEELSRAQLQVKSLQLGLDESHSVIHQLQQELQEARDLAAAKADEVVVLAEQGELSETAKDAAERSRDSELSEVRSQYEEELDAERAARADERVCGCL